MSRLLHLHHGKSEKNAMKEVELLKLYVKKDLREKLESLYEEYKKLSPEPLQCKEKGDSFGVFFSVGNDDAKAEVFFGCGASAEKAWKDAVGKVQKHLEQQPREVLYCKLDIPYAVECVPLETVNSQLEGTKMSFWRKGIALDAFFQMVFLEQELNANQLILYDQNGISLQNINTYLLSQQKKQLFYLPDFVYTFQCISFFCDEKHQVHSLYHQGLPYGRRRLTCVDDLLAAEVLATSGEKLAAMVGEDGRFAHGYRAVFHEAIPAYSILRHLSATWALIKEYARSKSPSVLGAVERAISFVLDSSVESFGDKAFVVERFADEVKLGGCALLAVVLEAYIRLTDKREYLPLVKQLGNGILFFAHPQNQEFWHVLAFPELTYKEKMRVPSYHGQGAFALALLYDLTKEERYLEGAKSIADAMLALNYAVYADPWVSYAMNALLKHCPDKKYFTLALKNITINLPRIYKQQTSYHIFLELLLASFEIYDKMKEEFSALPVLQEVDVRWFITSIYYRAQHQLNGYMYPEYMMYFDNPSPYLYSFVVRHDGFRMRMDDVGHFISGYSLFWKNFERLESHRIRLGITPADYMTFHERYLYKPLFSQGEGEVLRLQQINSEGGNPHGQG